MDPKAAADQLAARAKALRDQPDSPESLHQAAREVAAQVRTIAARRGDSIGVRVVVKNGGVRLTIVGRKAGAYRKLAKAELERRVPQIKAEIRTHLQRSTK